MKKAFDRNAKQGMANELIGNMGHGKVAEEDLKRREAQEYQDKVRQAQLGEQNAKIAELEKKADHAR